MIIYFKHFILSLLLIQNCTLEAFSNSYFYRASTFWQEPRFERELLSSFDIALIGGSTCISRGCNKKKVPLLNLYQKKLGTQNARFTIFEIDLLYTQNIFSGFFTEVTVPFIHANLYPCYFQSCSYKDRINTRSIKKPFKESLFTDATVLVGWTTNYEDTRYIDFIDATFKIGVSTPLQKRYWCAQTLEIPLNYANQSAVIGALTTSFGLYDWLTIGAHANVLRFIQKSSCRLGNISRAGVYIKADHLCKGISLLLAATYEQQKKIHGRLHYIPIRSFTQGWSRTLVHLMLEYDSATLENNWGLRVALIYNKTLTGRNIFQTNTLEGSLGCDISWAF
jgi:hypothetical protein